MEIDIDLDWDLLICKQMSNICHRYNYDTQAVEQMKNISYSKQYEDHKHYGFHKKNWSVII